MDQVTITLPDGSQRRVPRGTSVASFAAEALPQGVVRKEVRRLRAILHHARTEGLDAQNREGRPNFRAWLRGKIASSCKLDKTPNWAKPIMATAMKQASSIPRV